VFGALGILAIAFPQVLGNGKNIAQLALSDKLGMALLFALLVAKFIATVGCLATGAPGGLFMPTIAIGALAGGLTGQLWQQHWVLHDAGSCVLIGAGALLAASTQGPVSATVLILELSANANGLILPLVIARVPPANARTGGEFAADAGRPGYVGGHPVLSWRQEARRADYRDHRRPSIF
jgi:H+/Cl- antiporter ClcA